MVAKAWGEKKAESSPESGSPETNVATPVVFSSPGPQPTGMVPPSSVRTFLPKLILSGNAFTNTPRGVFMPKVILDLVKLT